MRILFRIGARMSDVGSMYAHIERNFVVLVDIADCVKPIHLAAHWQEEPVRVHPRRDALQDFESALRLIL
jgi:hypothetical protein